MVEYKNNTCFQIVGPSGSGKTHFVCKLIQNPQLFENSFNRVYWHHGDVGEDGLTGIEMCRLKSIKHINGFDKQWMTRLVKGDVIIIDDLYHEVNKQEDFNNLFTKVSRHTGVTVFFITQNLFHQGGQHRTRNLNVQYLVLFKNPRDATAIDYVSRQAFPNNKSFLIDSFHDATRLPHGYLFIDFTQSCPDDMRVQTDIFNTNGITVYKQRL
jgi:nucleoside-triphosphatase THEP1